jgi:hypothetical protein
MKRVLAVIGLGALIAALGVFAAVALAGDGGPPLDEHGCTPSQVFWQGTCQAGSTPITICHVAGLASDPANYVTLNITLAAAVGQAGHFGENGTPNAGHEQDTLGACQPPVVDIETTAGVTFHNATCDTDASVTYANTDKVSYAVTSGSIAAGQSVEITATAKDGFTLGEGQSVFTFTFAAAPTNCGPPPPADIEVTPGVTFQDPTCEVGAAVVPTTTTGLMYTIEGTVAPGEHVKVTASANDGYTIQGNNTWEHTFGLVPSNCVTPPSPADLCPNLEGIQEAVPDGYVLDAQGNCVVEETTTTTTPTAPLTPPTTTTKPAMKPPAKAKPAPLTPPTKTVAGVRTKGAAQAEAQPKLAYTP